MAAGIDRVVRQLTDAGVRKLEQLEVLLVLARQPEGPWDGERVALASMLARDVAAEALEHLHRCQLLALVDAGARSFRLDPRAPAGDLLELGRLYARDRARVTNSFFACTLDSLRSFASAFKLRRTE